MNAEVMQQPQLSNGRLLLLGVSSVVLCISFIMSVFAPFPLALAFILYGRGKGVLTGLAGLALSFTFASLVYRDLTLFGFYVCVFIFGFGIAEIVLRGFSPIKGIMALGGGFLAVIALSIGLFVKSHHVPFETFIKQQLVLHSDKIAEQKKIVEESGDKDAIQVLQLLDRPDLIAKEITESLPGYLFVGVFIMLWFNMYLALKSRRLLLSGHEYPYSEKHLLHFKVPFGWVVVLAIGLALAVWGSELGNSFYEVIGFTIIKCLGTFYFFQGFGVFSDLLSFLGIFGFFRTLIVMVVIFIANYIVAAAGLFDNWFDFRKYFIKHKNED